MQRILRLRESSVCASVSQIIVPDDPSQILYEPQRLSQRLSEKYCKLFRSSEVSCLLPVSQVEPVIASEILWSIKSIKTNKGLAIDCISDSILDNPPDAVTDRLVCLINYIFACGSISAPFCLSMLHLLNKLKMGTPSLSDLHLIMIPSQNVKLMSLWRFGSLEQSSSTSLV